MASNGYQYECRQTHTHTYKKNKQTNTHTWSQLTGAKGHRGGSQVLARYHIKNNTHFTDC